MEYDNDRVKGNNNNKTQNTRNQTGDFVRKEEQIPQHGTVLKECL